MNESYQFEAKYEEKKHCMFLFLNTYVYNKNQLDFFIYVTINLFEMALTLK